MICELMDVFLMYVGFKLLNTDGCNMGVFSKNFGVPKGNGGYYIYIYIYIGGGGVISLDPKLVSLSTWVLPGIPK